MASVCVNLDVDQVEQEVKDELWVRHLYPCNELLKIVHQCCIVSNIDWDIPQSMVVVAYH